MQGEGAAGAGAGGSGGGRAILLCDRELELVRRGCVLSAGLSDPGTFLPPDHSVERDAGGLAVYRRERSGSIMSEKLRREGKVPGVVFDQVWPDELPPDCLCRTGTHPHVAHSTVNIASRSMAATRSSSGCRTRTS